MSGINEATLLSNLKESMYDTAHVRSYHLIDCDIILSRLNTILSYRPHTIPMLKKQMMNFLKIMSRTSREHAYNDYKSYAYASVDDIFTVKFGLSASSEDEICISSIEWIKYKKDNQILTCEFGAVRAKIKTAPPTRNFRYAHTKFSYYDNFLTIDNSIVLKDKASLIAEIEDWLFDYTNIEELLNE